MRGNEPSLFIQHAAEIIRDGGIVAYPTEAVYGLGCDPFNENAVNTLCALKNRALSQGLILLASDLSQLDDIIDYAAIPADRQQAMLATWPGPHTWVCPASASVPAWICGNSPAVAVRVTAHPIAAALAAAFGGAIVSTSANRSGSPPSRIAAEVRHMLNEMRNDKMMMTMTEVTVLDGSVGSLAQPTEIRDVLTNQLIR